jgi:folate-binding protein YgfZ
MAEMTPLHEITAHAGATFTEVAGWQVPASFGDPLAEYEAARSGAILRDVSPRGKIEVTGGDAPTFLHNLTTNNIKDMPIGAGCEAFFANQRARIVSPVNVYLLQLHDGRPAFYLDLPPGMNEPILKHLDHYLISEQVEFADRTHEFAQIHLAGPGAKNVLERALVDDVPDLDEHLHMMRTFGTQATCSIRKHSPLGLPGYDILCLKSKAGVVWQMLTRAGAKPLGETAAGILRIEAGTPLLGSEIEENTFAPEVGRTAQAISYNKGCYLGQEPIVMARDRGHINRLLRGVKLANVVPHNSKLYAGEQEAGRVTSSVVSPRLGAIGLAYVRRNWWEPGTALTVDVNGDRQPATVVELPFAL